jgi:outer membrane receptor protein involved in Fe transport
MFLHPLLIWLALQGAPLPTLAEEVNVTAGRRLLRGLDSPAAVTVRDRAELDRTPALLLDDVLRQSPGFSLFRRTSSRSANPTTQGVTLRGLSASGASRTLVLVDGVAINDPFGGWVPWGRVPAEAIERVEVARGGLGDLYGPLAAGGVVQVLTARPAGPLVRGTVEGGTSATARVGALAGTRWERCGMFGSVERFRTDGSIPVSAAERGPVDVPAGSRRTVALGGGGCETTGGVRVAIRAGALDEDRTNGTPLQWNRTFLGHGGLELGGLARGVAWVGRAHAGSQDYEQTFSAVTADRRTEALTQLQDVPSDVAGGALEGTFALGGHMLLAGTEARTVSGRSRQTSAAGIVTENGGRQRDLGGFLQWRAEPAPTLALQAGVRYDHRQTRLDEGGGAADGFASPRATLSWRATPGVVVHGTYYRAFRPPTLNELVRPFRVGQVLTQANPALVAERLHGGEVSIHAAEATRSARATLFSTTLDGAITNVTVSTQPALITRQRRNAATVQSRGLELEGELRPAGAWQLRGALALTRARFTGAVEPGLDGNRVPQVPAVQVSAGLRYTGLARTDVSLDVRGTGSQFDDDRNAFELGRAIVLDALVMRTVRSGAQVFLAAENVLGAEFDVGRTPVRTVGMPRTVRAGVRVVWPWR